MSSFLLIQKFYIIFKELNTQYFHSNRKFTDKGLTKFGNSLQNLKSLNSFSLNFHL